jgi:hypothetical protein
MHGSQLRAPLQASSTTVHEGRPPVSRLMSGAAPSVDHHWAPRAMCSHSFWDRSGKRQRNKLGFAGKRPVITFGRKAAQVAVALHGLGPRRDLLMSCVLGRATFGIWGQISLRIFTEFCFLFCFYSRK